MIVNTTTSGSVDVSGVEKNKAFSIEMGGKAFKMLSDTLYTNKPGSIVRELSCNAVDSHNAAGKGNVPFDIHLPSVYEPTFYVRDYGLGMSPEMIESTYTTYFKSTKDQSNDAIGGMGLGGKTPFAYTTSFNVTSIWNGTKYFYAAMLDENDVPSISLFGSEATTECNGVMVEFNVEQNDYHRFINEIFEQLRFFDMKPNLLNVGTGKIFTPIVYREDFGSLKVSDSLQGMWIVQGGVGYRVDRNQFADKVDDKTKLEFFDLYPNCVMFFDIGKIEVTISREGVSYSKHTIKSIVEFVDEYAPRIYKGLVGKIETMATDWERLVFLNSDQNNRRFAKMAKMTFGEGGNTGDKSTKIEGGGNSLYHINLTQHWRGATVAVSDRKFNMAYFVRGKGTRKYFNERELVIAPDEKITIFIRDTAKAAIGRVKTFADNNGGKTVYLVEHPGGTDKVDAAFIQHIRDIMGGVEVTLASSLPEPVKNPTEKKGPVIVYQHPEDESDFMGESIYKWDRVYDAEELVDGYYMAYETFPFIDERGPNLEVVGKVWKAKLFDKPVFVIKSKNIELLQENPNFSCAVEKAKEIIEEKKKELVKSALMMERYALAMSFVNETSIKFNNSSIITTLRPASKEFPKHSLVARVDRAKKLADRYVAKVQAIIAKEQNILIREMINQYTVDKDKKEANANRVKNVLDDVAIAAFYDKYPMTRELERNTYGWMEASEKALRTARIVDYIKLVDKHG